MIDIVIPYLHSEAVWNELIFTVRSIEKHFKVEHRIILVGDSHPSLNIPNIPAYQVKKKRFAKAWDSIIKMGEIVKMNGIGENFVYWYDDIVLLKDIDLSFFETNYMVHDMALVSRSESNNYGIIKWHTYDVMQKLKLPTYSHETHLPKYFNKEKMKTLLDKFCQVDKNLLLNSLYMNYYFREDKPIELRLEDEIKAGFYGCSDAFGFGNAVNYKDILKKKTFLNYNNKGLTENLKKEIISRLKTKSSYEK